MAPPEIPDTGEGPLRSPSQPPEPPSYGRYIALLAIVILIFITINTILTKPNGAGGIVPGEAVPPFAVPLATASLPGDANVATNGPHPACSVRKAGVLNMCELYEQGPVVLALFVNSSSCTDVLSEMQALVPLYPKVRFAAVSIKGDRPSLRRLIARRRLSFPVGIDDQGDLLAFYRVASCPQVSFILRGGVVESRALLSTPSPGTLRARVAELAAAGTPAPSSSG